MYTGHTACSWHSFNFVCIEAVHHSHEICECTRYNYFLPIKPFSIHTYQIKIQSTLQNLLITVGSTLLRSTSLIGVLVAIILTYAFTGNLFFNHLHAGEAIDYGIVNFNGAIVSINIAIRVITGEDWHHLLADAMVGMCWLYQIAGKCEPHPQATPNFQCENW